MLLNYPTDKEQKMKQKVLMRSLQQGMAFLQRHIVWKYGLILTLLLMAAAAVAAKTSSHEFYGQADVYYGTPAQAFVTSWRLNVRYGPGTSYGVLTKLANGDSMKVLGHSAAGQWLLVEMHNGYQGWVWSEYVSSLQPAAAGPQVVPLQPVAGVKTAVSPPTSTTNNTPIGTVTSNHLNLRYGPDTAYDIILKLQKNETVTVLGRNEQGTWLYVHTPYGFDGWVWHEYLRLTLPSLSSTATLFSNNQQCDPSYPDFCLTPYGSDLDCKDIPYSNFRVFPPDRHRFDGDHDGIGCEQ